MKTVRLTTCVSSYEAHVLQGALEAEGISSVLHNENMNNIYGWIGAMGVDVFVYEDQLEKALEVLNNNKKENNND